MDRQEGKTDFFECLNSMVCAWASMEGLRPCILLLHFTSGIINEDVQSGFMHFIVQTLAPKHTLYSGKCL